MKIISVPSFFQRVSTPKHSLLHPQSGMKTTVQPPGLARIAYWSERQLPPFVRRCPVAMKYLALLRPLDWANLPWRDTNRPHPGPAPTSPLPYIAAFLIKLDQQHRTMGQLRQYLVDHPALTWSLGFPLQMCLNAPHGFDVATSLPSPARFSFLLRFLSNQTLQYLLTDTVHLLQRTLSPELSFGRAVSLDTKHIIAWVSAPCHGVLYSLKRGCRQFAKPARSPPLAVRETALRT